MEDNHLPSPSVGKLAPALAQAYQIAREKLSEIQDIIALCRNSGATCRDTRDPGSIMVEYLHRPYIVLLHDAEITPEGNAETISIREKVLLLHYLLTAKGTPLSGKSISFQELPDGIVYYPTFLKRSVLPLLANFGFEPGLLLQTAGQFGGKPAALGDASVTINAFPRVPLTIVIWQADEEFEARGNILFDSGISDYLPTEDITIVCETLAWKLIKAKAAK